MRPSRYWFSISATSFWARSRNSCFLDGITMSLMAIRSDVDHLVVALAVGDEAFEVLVLDLGHFLLGALEELLLLGRDHHVLDGDQIGCRSPCCSARRR